MPRELTFSIQKKEYQAVPFKIDRKKLYGWTEVKAFDEDGRECTLVNTDETGTLLIPKGGTSLGILSPDGNWVERSSLKTVKNDGTDAPLITSSYSTVINLKNKIKEEEFLNYSITDFYQLQASGSLIKAVGKNIYTFEYTYLDSYETIPAFLIAADNSLFMLLGYENKFEYLCLGDCEIIDEDDDFIQVDDDDIDFSMF